MDISSFRQFFDAETGTYTYLIWDHDSRDAVLIDPVKEKVSRDLEMIRELGLSLMYVLETHVHADHVTGAHRVRLQTGAQIGISIHAGAEGADIQLKEGMTLHFGKEILTVWETPGHTDCCLSFIWRDGVFSGDTLLIRKCGRTDFQQGDSSKLFRSVHERLFSLPDATFVFPAHEYEGRGWSTIGEEKELNARLKEGMSEQEFVEIMKNLNLPAPKKIAEAVPANLHLGR